VVRITKALREEGAVGSSKAGKDAGPESLPIVRVLWFLVLTVILCLASNMILVLLHELGHFFIAASAGHASSSVLVGKYVVRSPPFLWFGGEVGYDGQEAGLTYAVFLLAPLFTTLIPVLLLLGSRRLHLSTERHEEIEFVLRSCLLFWLLLAFVTLLPSRGTFEGLSDGAALFRAAGSEFAVASLLGAFFSEWISGVFFYAGWWLISSFLSAGLMKLSMPRVRLIVLSLSTFALLYVAGVFASVLLT
jgi:hypothetical protein